jgi:hypothetical protein
MRQVSKNKNEIVGSDSAEERLSWKRRPSEIKGYQRALYVNDNDGNFIRLDYNLKTKKVRIFYEPSGEGGVSYYSAIENGEILSEKNLTSGRTTNLHSKFSALAPKIASIPNREVLKIIGNNYGLQNVNKDAKEKARKQEIEKTRRRYFQNDSEERKPVLGFFDKSKRASFTDIFDIIIGVGIGGAIYYFIYNFQILAFFLALYGISLGIIDMFLRDREPIFIKIILFLALGVGSYVYGYYLF